jgi:hypothetical protein
MLRASERRLAFTAALCVLLLAVAAQADIPSPDGRLGPRNIPRIDGLLPRGAGQGFQEPVERHAHLVLIAGAGRDGEAHLRFGRALMKSLHADEAGDRQSGSAAPLAPAVMAGLALSLGFVLTGFWLVRSRPRRTIGLPALALTGLLAAGFIGCFWDNGKRTVVPVYEPARPLHSESPNSLSGEALLEVDERAENVELTIPREALSLLQEKTPPVPPIPPK